MFHSETFRVHTMCTSPVVKSPVSVNRRRYTRQRRLGVLSGRTLRTNGGGSIASYLGVRVVGPFLGGVPVPVVFLDDDPVPGRFGTPVLTDLRIPRLVTGRFDVPTSEVRSHRSSTLPSGSPGLLVSYVDF